VGCLQTMWAHLRLLWVRRPACLLPMWADKFPCLRANLQMIVGRYSYRGRGRRPKPLAGLLPPAPSTASGESTCPLLLADGLGPRHGSALPKDGSRMLPRCQRRQLGLGDLPARRKREARAAQRPQFLGGQVVQVTDHTARPRPRRQVLEQDAGKIRRAARHR
jgi:hypothetical protein